MAVFGLPFLFAGLFVLLITCVGRGTVTSY